VTHVYSPGYKKSSRRPHPVRPRTLRGFEYTTRPGPEVVAFLRDHPRRTLPATRGECLLTERPCQYVWCKWNLYMDVGKGVVRGPTVKLNFPDLTPAQIPARGSCALDVADRGGATLERVAQVMNMTRERVRQIEEAALRRIHLPILRELR